MDLGIEFNMAKTNFSKEIILRYILVRTSIYLIFFLTGSGEAVICEINLNLQTSSFWRLVYRSYL